MRQEQWLFPVSAIIALMMFLGALALGLEHAWPTLLLALSSIPLIGTLLSAMFRPGQAGYTVVLCLYFLALLIFPGMLHCISGAFPFFHVAVDDNLAVPAAMIVLLFSFSFTAGWWRFQKKIRASSLYEGRWSAKIRPRRVAMIGIGFGAMALIGFSVFGGPAYFLVTIRESALLADKQISDPLHASTEAVIRASGLLCLLLTLVLYKANNGKWFPRLDLTSLLGCLAILAACAVYALVNLPTNLTRFQVGASGLAIIYLVFGLRAAGAKTAFVCIFIFGLLTVFPVLSNFSRGTAGSDVFENPFTRYVESGDFDGFQSVTNVVRIVQDHGVSWGSHLVSSLFSFIPRSMWPAKELPTGVEAAINSGYGFTNISEPLPGEIFRDFGWFGVALGGFGLGVLISKLDSHFEAMAAQGKATGIITHAIAIGYLTIILRGSLEAISAAAMSVIGIAILVDVLVRAPHASIIMQANVRQKQTRGPIPLILPRGGE